MRATFNLKLPAYWASALINNDTHALIFQDSVDIELTGEALGVCLYSATCCSDGPFITRTHDAIGDHSGKRCECLEYSFIVD
jgi:hypothetical protein